MKKAIFLSLVGMIAALMPDRAEAQLLYANSTDTFLHIIDLATDSTSQQLFDLGVGPTGLAVDDANGIIYWTESDNLFTTTYSGVTTQVGSFGITLLGGLAFDSVNGVLYGSENSSGLYTIDTQTGTPTFIGDVTDPAGGMFVNLGGLAYDPLTDQLVASNDGSADALVSVDPVSLTTDFIAGHDGDVDGLAAANGIAYLVNANSFEGYIGIDIETGVTVETGPLFFNADGTFSAGAWAPGLLVAIPEPGSLGLLAIGAVSTMFRRRRSS